MILVVVGVSSQCTTGRIYVGNVNMSNAELIVFNGIYVQQQNVVVPRNGTKDSGLVVPVYKHESREQFLHLVFVDDHPHWRIGIRRVGGQTSFVDYLSAPSVDADDPMTPDMTSHWYVRSRRSPSWSLARRLRAKCVEPDFVTCTTGLLSVSGLSRRHRRWHSMRMGTYRITSLTNQLRPVYKSVPCTNL